MQLLICLSLLLLASSVKCWLLTTNKDTAAPTISVNITIQCSYNGYDHQQAKMVTVNRVRISKFTQHNSWKTIAQVKRPNLNTIITNLFDAEVTGQIGDDDISDTYLKIYYPVATEESFGQYKCQADGYDANSDITAEQTRPVVVSSRVVGWKDLYKILDNLKKRENDDQIEDKLQIGLLQTAINALEVKDKTRGNALTRLFSQVDDLSDQLSRLSDNFTNEKNKLTKDIAQIELNVQTKYWPAGVYSILSSSSGCPYSNTFEWQNSSVKIATEPGNYNNDAVSKPSHLAGNTLQKDTKTKKNFVYTELCSKVEDTTGNPWPKGSYCVQSYNTMGQRECPMGFNSGGIAFDTYNGFNNEIVNLPHYYKSKDVLTLYYCCRNDNNPTDPILLPSRDPFYLYRFKGRCQQVIGMDVSDEWIAFHTNNDDDNYVTDYHPDGRLKGVKIELCYYTPAV